MCAAKFGSAQSLEKRVTSTPPCEPSDLVSDIEVPVIVFTCSHPRQTSQWNFPDLSPSPFTLPYYGKLFLEIGCDTPNDNPASIIAFSF